MRKTNTKERWLDTLENEIETERDKRQGQENKCDCASTKQEPRCIFIIVMAPILDLIYFCLRCRILSLNTFHFYPFYLFISDSLIALSLHKSSPLLSCIAKHFIIRFFFLHHNSTIIPLSTGLFTEKTNHCLYKAQPQKMPTSFA